MASSMRSSRRSTAAPSASLAPLQLTFASIGVLLTHGRRSLTTVRGELPRIGNRVPLVGLDFPLVRRGLTLVSPAFALTGQTAAFIDGFFPGDDSLAIE